MDSATGSTAREQRDGPDRDPFGPPDRAQTLAPLRPHRHARCRGPSARAAAPARRRGSRPSPRRAARAAASPPRSTTSTFSIHQPSLRDLRRRPRRAAPSSRRRGTARRWPGTACRDRAGRPARGSRRRPRARPRRRRSARRAGARRRCVTPPSTSGGASPNGCTSNPSPTRFLTRWAPSISACASSRSSASVSLRLRALALDDDHGAARGLDERGVVGVDAVARVRALAATARAERLRGLHRDQVVARHGLDDAVGRAPASPCR